MIIPSRSTCDDNADNEKRTKFDSKELKKITVKILRKTPQNTVPTLKRDIVDPATVTLIRRPGKLSPDAIHFPRL